MEKTIKITRCDECPFYNQDDNTDPQKWGKFWCDHPELNAELTNEGGAIPENCPLP